MSNQFRKYYMLFECFALTIPVILFTWHYGGLSILCTMFTCAIIVLKRTNMHCRKLAGTWCPDMRWWWDERKIQNYYEIYMIVIDLAENNCKNRANDMPWNIYYGKDPLRHF